MALKFQVRTRLEHVWSIHTVSCVFRPMLSRIRRQRSSLLRYVLPRRQNLPFQDDIPLASGMYLTQRGTGMIMSMQQHQMSEKESTLCAISGTSSWKLLNGVLTSMTCAQSRFCMTDRFVRVLIPTGFKFDRWMSVRE